MNNFSLERTTKLIGQLISGDYLRKLLPKYKIEDVDITMLSKNLDICSFLFKVTQVLQFFHIRCPCLLSFLEYLAFITFLNSLDNKTPAKHLCNKDIFRLKKVWQRLDSNPLTTALEADALQLSHSN